MDNSPKLNRREFISSAAAALTTFSIVPSYVIAGTGHVPPSDQLTIANIGCGTQGLREMGNLLEHPNIRVVAVCDVNKFSTDYIDWSPYGLRNNISTVLEDNSWWEGLSGIPGGRDVGKAYVDQFYAKNNRSGNYHGCASYEDYRKLLDEVDELDAIKIMTPDHTHAQIAIDAMEKGIHVVTHKPIANRLLEGRKVIEKTEQSGVITHLLAWSERPEHHQIKAWIDEGLIGDLKEIHNWSYRPVWEQWTKRPDESKPVPEGFNWKLWLGPVPDMPYHPNYTHNVFRGWHDFGGGSVADMGHYSLFPLFETLGITRSPVRVRAYGTTTREEINQVYHWVDNDAAFPASCMIRWKFPEQETLPGFDLYWYDGGMKPFAPEELEADGREIPEEGLMFVGTKGKILGNFLGDYPILLPEKRMEERPDSERIISADIERNRDDWMEALLNSRQTPGSFNRAKTITDTVNLGAAALRAGSVLDFDEGSAKIKNNEEANRFLTREYRPGWEM